MVVMWLNQSSNSMKMNNGRERGEKYRGYRTTANAYISGRSVGYKYSTKVNLCLKTD